MVEIRIAVAEPELLHGLMRRLRRLFDPSSVRYNRRRKQVQIFSDWESRTAVDVIDAVQAWIDESGLGPTELEVGERLYTIAPTDSGRGAEEHAPVGLAGITAILAAAHGAADSRTLLQRICEGVCLSLGLERAWITRSLGDGEAVEVVASHGCADDDPAASTAPEAAVIPLVSGGESLGFLFAVRGAGPIPLDKTQNDVLTLVGPVIAALLERADAYDHLADRHKRQSEFVALASHELRTPTAAVCGIVTTLHVRGDILTADQRRGLSSVAHDEGQRLVRLVDQLLDLSRLEASSIRIRPIQLAVYERACDVVGAVAAGRAGEIEIAIDPALRAYADPEAFDRIVSNLLLNALRYGLQPIKLTAAMHDRHFRLAVEDRGPGVPDDFTTRLFDRFTRVGDVADGGAGLGLSIAQAYAHAHGGQLVYQRASPSGARFELVVPVSA
jgi:signal transduction histidine kinase